jgi:PcfJ-like protein
MGGPRPQGPLLSDSYPRYEAGAHSHRFVERWDAFRIEHPRRHRVEVRVQACALQVVSDSGTVSFELPSPPLELCRVVAGSLLGLPKTAADRPPPDLIREAWAIAEPLYRLREALLTRAAPVAWRVQERVAKVAGEVAGLAKCEALYRDPHLVRDILRHRAAAVALARLETHLWQHYHACRAGDAEPTPDVLVHAMSEWRGLFSPDGLAYRSLNRTLMNVPEEVSADLLCQLHRVRLERPLLSSLELRAVLTFAALARAGEPHADRLHVLQHARADEIRYALERIGAETERRLDPRSDADLHFAMRYLSDLPQARCRSLAGLVGRAIQWHREVAERREVSETVDRLGGADTPTARPPIPLPRFKGVRFLATVGEVAAEGQRMKHCIATYANDAVAGRAFLFHVEHEGHSASFEVDPDGDILQAAGPTNCTNAAVEYGFGKLRTWAKGFHRPRLARPRPPRRPPEALSQLGFPFAEAV